MKNIILAILLIFSMQNAFAFTLFGDSKITEFWAKSNAVSEVPVDHSIWDQLLNRYIVVCDDVNLFLYADVTQDDLKLLDRYLNQLQMVEVHNLQAKEQYAYWINLYNATTVNARVQVLSATAKV